MAGVGGCTSSGPQPFESLAASLRSQAELAERSATLARDERAVAQPVVQAVEPKGLVTGTRGNQLNITA